MSEAQEQRALFQWAGLAEQQYPELKLLHHIPNHGLYIELKQPKKGKLQKNQKEWLHALEKQGYSAKVCYGWLEAREVIEIYLSLNCLELLR